MNKKESQSGFAHLSIIIVLVVALICALGYIYWQNFIQPKSSSVKVGSSKATSTTKKPDAKADSSFSNFTNDLYIFEYPKTGWDVLDTKDSQGTVYIKSSDYKEADPVAGAISMSEGAVITIYKSADDIDIDEMVQSFKSRDWISNVKEITVDGQKAYSYLFTYEFPRYNTILKKNNSTYNITFNAAGGKYESYDSAYKSVNESLKIK